MLEVDAAPDYALKLSNELLRLKTLIHLLALSTEVLVVLVHLQK